MQKLILNLLVVAALSGCGTGPFPKLENGPPLVIAHRGAPLAAPENTLASIEAALEIGSPAIEIDVRRSSDGVPVLMHDDSLDRTTDGAGEIKDLDWETLKTLDAGSWFSDDFSGERIPRLMDVLELFTRHPGVVLIIEMKDGGAGFEESVLAAIRDSGLRREQVILKAFERDILARFAALDHRYERLYVFNTWFSWINLVIDEQPRFVNVLEVPEQWLQVNSLFLSESFVREAQAAGYRVIAWNVHEAESIQEMIDWGVDGIETDDPELALERVRAAHPEPPQEGNTP